MDFRASVNFLKSVVKLHVFVQFFFLGEYVCIFDRLFKGAQDSSRKVKNDSLVGEISYSHETATRKAGSVLLQRVCCRFTKERVSHVSWAVWGRMYLT